MGQKMQTKRKIHKTMPIAVRPSSRLLWQRMCGQIFIICDCGGGSDDGRVDDDHMYAAWQAQCRSIAHTLLYARNARIRVYLKNFFRRFFNRFLQCFNFFFAFTLHSYLTKLYTSNAVDGLFICSTVPLTPLIFCWVFKLIRRQFLSFSYSREFKVLLTETI